MDHWINGMVHYKTVGPPAMPALDSIGIKYKPILPVPKLVSPNKYLSSLVRRNELCLIHFLAATDVCFEDF